MSPRSIFLIFIFTFSLHATAQTRVLPHRPVLREHGVHQIGDSCVPTSLLTGLEHSFQRLDKPVKLSLSYFVFSLKIMADMAGMRLMPDLNYLTADSYKAIQTEKGWLLPSYMLPDEHEYSHLAIKGNLAMLPNPSFAGSCVNFGEKTPKVWTAMVSPDHSFFGDMFIFGVGQVRQPFVDHLQTPLLLSRQAKVDDLAVCTTFSQRTASV